MAKTNENARPDARLPKGMRDVEASELRATHAMLEAIRSVYDRYGFEPLETPAFEYTDALGKFLPDQDRPNEGVFSFQDEDSDWLSLRYDLTAPLARYVAQNYQRLPKPFRRYATGSVYRNEKPGPGRFRQFTQFDADTVGSDSVAADAEMCMLAADTLEALGVKRGDYVIKVNSRRMLDGAMELIGLGGVGNTIRRAIVLRAIDKLDRLGWDGVCELLGRGRRDESGDFTVGADLSDEKIYTLRAFIETGKDFLAPAKRFLDRPIRDMRMARKDVYYDNIATLNAWNELFDQQKFSASSVQELRSIIDITEAAGFGSKRIMLDPSVVRGLEYYTGPVFEAELTFEVKDEEGRPVRFGSVGGGGRYDDLVARFTGEKVPATGFSIGVSRLQAALSALDRDKARAATGPVVVLVMDKDQIPAYQKMTQDLRAAGVRAEMYLGSAGMKAQMKYADKRNAPCVVIQGSREREQGTVEIKDLVEGAKAAAAIKDNKDWKASRPAQISVPEGDLVAEVKKIVGRP